MRRHICVTAPLAAMLCAAHVAAQTTAVGNRPRATAAEQRTARHFEQIRQDPQALRAFLRAMPKGADLHTHLTGAVYAESYIRWAADMPLCIDRATFGFVEADQVAHSRPSTDSPATPVQVICRDPATQRPASDALQDVSLYRSVIDALSTRHWQAARVAGHYQFFDTFQKFGAAVRLDRRRSSEIVAKSIAEVVERAALQNVQHLEVMMAFGSGPPGEPAGDLSWDGDVQFQAYREKLLAGGLRHEVAERRQWLATVEQSTRATLGCASPEVPAACDVSVRYVPYALRALPPAQVFAQALFAFELAAVDPRIAGVNLVMPEDWFIPMRDYELHMRMFGFLRRTYSTVKVTLHAGELSFGLVPPEKLGLHVRQAIEIGGAHRIGHGTDIMYGAKPDGLLREMNRRRIAVEISLSSSDLILGVRGARHPIRRYLRAGVPVLLSTDDEGVARSDLTNEYQRAVEEHGVTYPQLKKISRNGIEFSFLPPEEKARLAQRLERAFAAFEAERSLNR